MEVRQGVSARERLPFHNKTLRSLWSSVKLSRPAHRQLVYAPDGLYSAADVMKMVGWSKFKLHQQVRRNKFPKSIPRKEERSGLARFWRKEVIDQWIADNGHLIQIEAENKKNSGLGFEMPKKHELTINAACKLCDCTVESFVLDAALTKARRVLDHYDFTENRESCFVSASQHARLSRNPKAVDTQ